MRRTLLATALVGLLAAGCASTEGSGTTDEPTGTNAPTAAATESAPPTMQSPSPSTTTSTTPPQPAAPANPTFGETYTWEDGISVTVSPPEPFEPSEYAIAGEWPAYLAFNVKVVNGTQANFDPSMFSTTLQSGNTEGDEVFDSANGFEGSPSTTLLPGREAVFKIGYGVQDAADLVMEVSPSFEHESAIFTS